MKNLNVACLFLCVNWFLSFPLNAQTTPEDTTVYKMSPEKADSLLINLFKEKSKKGIIRQDTTSYSTDTIVVDVLPALSYPIVDSVTHSPDTVRVKKNRKKAIVERSDLLNGQKTGYGIFEEQHTDVGLSNRRSVNEGTMIGFGGYKMRDRYLSQVDYGGLGFRFMNERLRLLKTTRNRVSRQNMVNVDVSSALNGAENANFLSAFVDYSIGYHYRFLPDPYFKIMLGGAARGLLGMVYNTRNGNNPMTLHADIDLNFSLMAIYEFRVKKRPVALRYQFETPFAGVLFSPIYDQSYYEIFSLGNTSDIFNFNSFHNKFAMRNYLTLDFPLGNMTLRAGYLGSYYSTNVRQIDRYVISHNFIFGFVKEFTVFSGREMRKRDAFESAYY